MPSTEPNRRRVMRVPCASAVAVNTVMGVVLNASLGGVMIRIAPPVQWQPGVRLTITIDAHDEPLAGEVVSIRDDRMSIRFLRRQRRLRVDAEDCVITLHEKKSHRP
jgi:hypothetical protein